MDYEFTRKKIAAERKAFFLRLAYAGLASLAGLGLGVALNGGDIGSIFTIVSASALATVAGVLAFQLTD